MLPRPDHRRRRRGRKAALSRARSSRHYYRHKHGVGIAKIEYSAASIDGLVRSRLLAEIDAANPKAIDHAFSALAALLASDQFFVAALKSFLLMRKNG
jgi:hypothetical protein